MAFSTIVTKFPATCRRCERSIPAGTRVRFGGRGRVWHFVSECATDATPDEQTTAARDFRRQQAGERAMEQAMDDAYAGTSDGFTFERVGYDR